MTNLSFIENELKKFNVTDAAIIELTSQYMPLTINGLDDKEGHKIVKEARLVVKRYRIDVDKRRKELNADALEYQRRINGEAKRITALLEPIEAHLANQEKEIDDEIERLRREKELAEQQRYQFRIAELTKLKFQFDGSKFYAPYESHLEMYVLNIKQWDDDAFNEFFGNAKFHFDHFEKIETERKLREEEERKALAAERARLDAIAKEQAEKEAALKAEEARLAYLKSKEEVMAPCPSTCEAPIHIHNYVVKPVVSDVPLKNGDLVTIDLSSDEKVARVIEIDSREYRKDIMFWQGFDMAIDLVLNTIDNQDSNDLPTIESLRDEIIEEVELYKTDG